MSLALSLLATYGSTGNTTTSAATPTGPADTGDVVMVTTHTGAATATLGITDTQGHTWQSTPLAGTATAPANSTQIWWTRLERPLTTADSITVTRTPTGGLAWTATRIQGAQALTDATTHTGTTRDVTGQAATPPAGGAVVLAYTCRDSVNITPAAGFTASTIARSSGIGNPRGGGYLHAPATGASLTPAGQIDIDLGWSAVQATVAPTADPTPPATGWRFIEYDGTTATELAAVEHDGTTTTPLGITVEDAGRGTLALIGDSNTYRDGAPPFGSREATTRARLVAAGWEPDAIYWWGAGGKAMTAPDQYGKTTLQNLADAVAQLGHVDTAVIALGTNDTPKTVEQFTADMNTILDACATYDVGQVLWVNLAYKSANNTNSTTFNPVIKATVEARTGGRVADWHTYIHTTSYDPADWISEDGTHYTAQGYAKRDAFIIATLDDEPAAPPPATALLGAYMGNFNNRPDLRFADLTGQPPDVMSTYYQAQGVGGGTINAAAENARIAAGTIPVITVTTAGGPWTHAQVASGAADAWLDYWASAIAALDDGQIWVTLDHEFEVKRNQGKFAWSPTDQHYADAFARFADKVRGARAATGKQQVKIMYWWGYFRHEEIDSIGAKITAHRAPDILAFDPYVFSHWAATTTFEGMVMGNGKLDWTRARSWYQGQPVGLAEFGKDGAHGDARCAPFLTDLRATMDTLGLAFALYFCRDKPGDVMLDLTPGGTWGPWPGTSGTYSKGAGSMSGFTGSVQAFIASVQSGGPNAPSP